jgi:cytochrome d ubiquinol oxidase subunit I
MEGVFAFFLESSFLYLLLFGERRLGPRLHWATAILVWLGTWLSGWFIIVTNAFMQHPVGHRVDANGSISLQSLGAFLTNPWAFAQYAHTMIGSVVTAAFVVAAVGAFYSLSDRHPTHADRFLRVGVAAGLIASILAAMPSGDLQAQLVAEHQPVAFAAMEGHFQTEEGAGLVVIGQPDLDTLTLDNPIVLPNVLSFLTHHRWAAKITGLADYDPELWPDNVELLYYAYHLMVGLGTIFIALMTLSAFMLWRGRLARSRALLWTLMLAAPLPYIANTTGWLTAELGRQPWVVHGLMRTAVGYSENVSTGNVLFSLLGFMGLYALLSILFLALLLRLLATGPEVRLGKP